MAFVDRFRKFRALACLATLAAGLVSAMPAGAQDSEATVIVVADVQRLLRESLAGASLESQITDLRTQLASGVAEREQALRQEEQELQEQMNILAPEVFADRRRAFEEAVVAFQQEVRSKQRSLDEVYGEGLNRIRAGIVEILQQMVDERGYDLILPQAQILVGSRDLDITDDVLEELNKRIPSVAITFDEN
jgi:Skp family chaperone for outer membrane proteins